MLSRAKMSTPTMPLAYIGFPLPHLATHKKLTSPATAMSNPLDHI